MEHGLEAMLLVLFDLVQAMGPQSDDGIDFRHVGCARSLSLIVANIGIFASVPRQQDNALSSAHRSRFRRNKAPQRSPRYRTTDNSGDDIAADYPRQRLATSSRTGVSTSGGALRI